MDTKQKARELVSVTLDLAVAGHDADVIIDVVDSLLRLGAQRQTTPVQPVVEEPRVKRAYKKKGKRAYSRGPKPNDWTEAEKQQVLDVLLQEGSRKWRPNKRKYALNHNPFKRLERVMNRTENAIVQMAKKLNRELNKAQKQYETEE